MTIDLWVSVALAIPLAVLANIFTPRVQNWLDSFATQGKKRKAAQQIQQRQKQLIRLEKELEQTEVLQADKASLTHHYLNALIRVAFYGAFGAIYQALFIFIGELGSWDGLLGRMARVGAQMVSLFIAMAIFLTCSKVSKSASRVRNYAQYKDETIKLIEELRGLNT